MSWRERITAYARRDIEISNDMILGHLRIVDSDLASIHHNSILYYPVEPPETLPHVQPPGNFGIVAEDITPEVFQSEGNPLFPKKVLIADNLVKSCNNGILVAGFNDLWTDWTVLEGSILDSWRKTVTST